MKRVIGRSYVVAGLLAAALGLGFALVVAMNGSTKSNDGVIVERPHRFRVELPPGWQIILPEPVTGERVPLFSASPAARKRELIAVLFAEKGASPEETFQMWAERLAIRLGEPQREADASRELITATGAGIDRVSGRNQAVMMAVIRSPRRPEEMWIFSCLAPDLLASPCEQIIRGFTLLQ